jgi:triacylglycerol lipase
LATISTTHHGSPYADWTLRRTSPLNFGGPALRELTTAACADFNRRTPDHPRVRYFSISAATPDHKIPLFARKSHRLIFDAEGPDDGRVSVSSATWATHLQTWPANHWEQRNLRRPSLIRDSSDQITPLWLTLLDAIQHKI